MVISGGYDRTIRLWDSMTGECKNILVGHTGAIKKLIVNNDESLLISAGCDYVIKIWNFWNNQSLFDLVGHTGWVYALQLVNDTLLSAGEEKEVFIWSFKDRVLLTKIKFKHTILGIVNEKKEDSFHVT